MNSTIKSIFIFLISISATFAHGVNWSKVYISKTDRVLTVELHINDLNIGYLPGIKSKNKPVQQLLKEDISFVTSEVWKGISILADNNALGRMTTHGYRMLEGDDSSISGELHTHGNTAVFTGEWNIPHAFVRVRIGLHLFHRNHIAMKWLVIAGVSENRKTYITDPGNSVEFDFDEKVFLTKEKTLKRFLPLLIAFCISILLSVGSWIVYRIVSPRKKK